MLPEGGCLSKFRDVPGSWPEYTGSPPGFPGLSQSLDTAWPLALPPSYEAWAMSVEPLSGPK